MDPEEIEDSSNPTIGSSSEMNTEVSLINYLLLSVVIMILVIQFFLCA